MNRLTLHCQMSQVVHPSGEINWLSVKQQACRQEPRHMVRIGHLKTTVSSPFLAFSHYDLDSTLMMNASACRILF